ncbi:MAG: hypothetical protein IIC79_06185 [Chloroflexi bacterium]|nr:hypothetical protein [Chloroflexota bacterium]
MPKTFYTDHDIEDMAQRGVTSLVVDDNVVLTDLARDKAQRLGVELVREDDKPPSAPERPYIAKPVATPASASSPAPAAPANDDELHQRVKSAVLASLGDGVDANLLDTIIRRVLSSIKTS